MRKSDIVTGLTLEILSMERFLTQNIGNSCALTLANNDIARLLPTDSDPQGCLDTVDQSHGCNEPKRRQHSLQTHVRS